MPVSLVPPVKPHEGRSSEAAAQGGCRFGRSLRFLLRNRLVLSTPRQPGGRRAYGQEPANRDSHSLENRKSRAKNLLATLGLPTVKFGIIEERKTQTNEVPVASWMLCTALGFLDTELTVIMPRSPRLSKRLFGLGPAFGNRGARGSTARCTDA